jgi:uncharacterized protein (DUF488 family)
MFSIFSPLSLFPHFLVIRNYQIRNWCLRRPHSCYDMVMSHEIYTIGYASFSISEFIDTLRKYAITALADVRSAPYSRYKQEFKKDNLNKVLAESNILYIFLGNQVGARVEDPGCFVNGKLNYGLLKESDNFRTGIDRILNGMRDYRIALMCAEKDPVNCHRMFLVCRALRSYPIEIFHILEDGSLEGQSDTEKRILQLYDLDQPDIFRSERERVEEVYDRMCKGVGREG